MNNILFLLNINEQKLNEKIFTSFGCTSFDEGAIGYDEIIVFMLWKIHVGNWVKLGIKKFAVLMGFIVKVRICSWFVSLHHFAAGLVIFAITFYVTNAGSIVLFGLTLQLSDELFYTLFNWNSLRRLCIGWNRLELWPWILDLSYVTISCLVI